MLTDPEPERVTLMLRVRPATLKVLVKAGERAGLHVDRFVVGAALKEALRGTPAQAAVPAFAPPPPGLVGALECGRYDQAARVLLPLLQEGALGRLGFRPSSVKVTRWFRAELHSALAYIPERCRRKLAAALRRAARHKAR
jgi:hypothetical protein